MVETFSIAEALRAPLRVIRRHPLAIFVWGLLIVGFVMAMMMLVFGALADIPLSPDAEPSPQVMGRVVAMQGVSMLLNVGQVVLGVMVWAATMRATFRIGEQHEAYVELTGSKVKVAKTFEPNQISSSTSAAATALGPSTWYPLNATTQATYDTVYNALAGYFGGRVDALISRIVDVWMSFPPVLLAIVLVSLIGTGLTSVGFFIVAVIFFLSIPRVGTGFFFRGQNSLHMVGFSDGVKLGGHGRLKTDSTIVMRVQVSAKEFHGRRAPYLYWRGVVFDPLRFAWKESNDTDVNYMVLASRPKSPS